MNVFTYEQYEEFIKLLNEKSLLDSASATWNNFSGEIFFRYDFPEDPDDSSGWDEYCFVQEELRAIGYELDDSCTEHDCVSGTMSKL